MTSSDTTSAAYVAYTPQRSLPRDQSQRPKRRLRRLVRLVGAAVLGALLLFAGWGPAVAVASADAGSIPYLYDVDGNDVYDPYLYDVTGPDGVPDGHIDQNWVTLTGLQRNGWLTDRNQNTLTDLIIVDFNVDTKPDSYFWINETDGQVLDYWLDPAVFPNVNIFAGKPGGLSLQIFNDPLGTSPNDLVDTVDNGGGIVTNPCDPLTWTLGSNLVCVAS